MPKRQHEGQERQYQKHQQENQMVQKKQNENEDEWENLSYEDDHDDEYEQEDILNMPQEEEDDDFEDVENDDQIKQKKEKKQKKQVKFQDMDIEDEDYDEEDYENQKSTPFLDSNKNLQEGEVLEFDNKAYEMLQRANTEWPFLSFDLITDLNVKPMKMEKYPYEIFFVAGTQSTSQQNYIYLNKLSKLHKTINDDDSFDEENSDNSIDNGEEAEFVQEQIQINSCVNRIRAMNNTPIVACQCENGQVMILNLEQKYKQMQNEGVKKFVSKKKKQKSDEIVATFQNQSEGFALNWNPLKRGQFASGQQDKKLYIYDARDNFTNWNRIDNPYTFHTDSVEDIQFSPNEDNAFASCSVDKSIKICDLRVGKKNQAQISIDDAHQSDVNVISWSQSQPRLLASGGDDCVFKVWDLRHIKKGCLNEILWHNEPITSIAFQPLEESVVAVSSADNRLSIWDFSVENEKNNDNEDIPDQLMFLHQGQENIKEIMYHPVYYEMVLSTGSNGFHVFKPAINELAVSSESEGDDPKDVVKIDEKELDKYLGQLNINQ